MTVLVADSKGNVIESQGRAVLSVGFRLNTSDLGSLIPSTVSCWESSHLSLYVCRHPCIEQAQADIRAVRDDGAHSDAAGRLPERLLRLLRVQALQAQEEEGLVTDAALLCRCLVSSLLSYRDVAWCICLSCIHEVPEVVD